MLRADAEHQSPELMAIGTHAHTQPQRSVLMVEQVGDLSQRRRRALRDAVSELALRSDSREAATATRVYGEGCLVLVLGGVFDRAALQRLRDLTGELHRLAAVELVIDLSRLRNCPPRLVRAVARIRVKRLVHGARVELHNPPPEIAADLGDTPAQTFDLAVDDLRAPEASSPSSRNVNPLTPRGPWHTHDQ